MASTQEALNQALTIEGASAAMLVDYDSGMSLGSVGSGIDLDVAAAGNTQVVRAKMRTMEELALNDGIEDILISLGDAYHVIRPLPDTTLFFYMVLNRKQSNLAMARHKVGQIVGSIEV